MKNILFLTLFSISTLAYAAGPKIKSVEASKTDMSPGDQVEVTVKLKGKAKLITSMEFIVREFPYDVAPIALTASDAKKKVWTTTIPVPYEAPPGTFHLELKVNLDGGEQLESPNSAENSYGKAYTLIVTVK